LGFLDYFQLNSGVNSRANPTVGYIGPAGVDSEIRMIAHDTHLLPSTSEVQSSKRRVWEGLEMLRQRNVTLAISHPDLTASGAC
jgi:hypothetical protein